MTDEGRAILIVAALLSSVSGSGGFVAGRVSAPVPPAEVRYVTIPAPAAVVLSPVDVAPEPLPALPAAPVVAEPEPVAPELEAAPLPKPRPKVEEKPKSKPKPKARPSSLKKSLPSCAYIKGEFARMTWAERMAEYRNSTAEEIAHGRRCLGM